MRQYIIFILVFILCRNTTPRGAVINYPHDGEVMLSLSNKHVASVAATRLRDKFEKQPPLNISRTGHALNQTLSAIFKARESPPDNNVTAMVNKFTVTESISLPDIVSRTSLI